MSTKRKRLYADPTSSSSSPSGGGSPPPHSHHHPANTHSHDSIPATPTPVKRPPGRPRKDSAPAKSASKRLTEHGFPHLMTAPGVDVQTVCRRLFDCVRYYRDDSDRLLAEAYLQLPPRSQFPEYDVVIEKPMPMNSIHARLDHNKFKTFDSFRTDMELVFMNAKKFNQPQSRIYRDALFLQTRFRAEVEQCLAEGLLVDEDGGNGGLGNGPVQDTGTPQAMRKIGGTSKKDAAAAMRDLEAMVQAIEADDLKSFKQYLAKALDLNTLVSANLFGEDFTWAPLHAAAYYNRIPMARELLSYGADLELSDTWYGSRPLGWAAYSGNFDMSVVLVDEFGADTAFANTGGQTALDMVSEPDDPRWEKILSPKKAKSLKTHKKKQSAGGLIQVQADGSIKKSQTSVAGTPLAVRLIDSAGGSPNLANAELGDGSGRVKIKIPPMRTAGVPAATHTSSTGGSGPSTPVSKPRTAAVRSLSENHGLDIDVEGVSSGDDDDDENDNDDDGGQAGVDHHPPRSVTARAGGSTSGSAPTPTPSNNSGGASATPLNPSTSNTPTISSQRPTTGLSALVTPQTPPPRSLVTSLGIVSNDDHIRMILPIPSLPLNSHAMTIPPTVRSLNLRLLLLAAQNVTYTITGTQHVFPGDPRMRSKTLNFKMGGATVFDCLVALEEGVNAFEFVVVGGIGSSAIEEGTSPLATGSISQKLALFMNRV